MIFLFRNAADLCGKSEQSSPTVFILVASSIVVLCSTFHSLRI